MQARTPPMGFNTWNTFGGNIHEKLVKECADAFITFGLKDAGYEYLVIDDCWSERQREGATGKIIPDKAKFPNGMKAIGDYVHSKGLKFGLYGCAGTRTCADYPGSFDHEFPDAETFAEYGCDYLKYDYCNKPANASGELLYRRMGLALKASGREILFSACNWGQEEPYKWMRSAGAHLYRSTGDIVDNYESFRNIAVSQLGYLYSSAPGCFNDLDMLTAGMYGKGLVGSTGCNYIEYRTQFSLWCLSGSPLMLGCDIRAIPPEIRALVTNKYLIRIDQDTEARPPIVCQHVWNDGCKVLVKHLSDNEFAFGFYNFTEKDSDIPLYFEETGLPSSSGYGFFMLDVFTGLHIGLQKEFMNPNVEKHGCRVYLAKLIKA